MKSKLPGNDGAAKTTVIFFSLAHRANSLTFSRPNAAPSRDTSFCRWLPRWSPRGSSTRKTGTQWTSHMTNWKVIILKLCGNLMWLAKIKYVWQISSTGRWVIVGTVTSLFRTGGWGRRTRHYLNYSQHVISHYRTRMFPDFRRSLFLRLCPLRPPSLPLFFAREEEESRAKQFLQGQEERIRVALGWLFH